MQNGAIVGVTSGLKLGNDAVESLLLIKQASYGFSPTLFNPVGSKPDLSYVSLLIGAEPSVPSDSNVTTISG